MADRNKKHVKAFSIVPMEARWIPAVVEIHMQSLPNDFLPRLGKEFLQNVFYPAAMASPFGKVFVAVGQEKPVGLVIATSDSSKFIKSIVQNHLLELIKIGARTSISSFFQFKNNIEILLSIFKRNVKTNFGEIYEIAVSQDKQSMGIGKALVQVSLEYLRKAGNSGIKIKTLKENKAWIEFFLRNGWKLSSEFRLIGKEYVILGFEF